MKFHLKKVVFSSLVLLGLAVKSYAFYASTSTIIFRRDMEGRAPNIHASQDFHKSSNTAANTSSLGSAVIISTTSGTLFEGVIVNSIGTSDAVLKIFDASTDTSTFASAIPIATINTSSNTRCPCYYNLDLSSGLAINNYGTTPADVTLIYLDRRQ